MQSTHEQAATILRFFRYRASLESADMAPPATPDQIAAAEQKLDLLFPQILRELYLTCGGFAATSGIYLSPLFGENGTVDTTLFMRALLAKNFPPTKTSGWIVFGSNGCDDCWILRVIDRAFEMGTYDAECDEEFVRKSSDLLAFYLGQEREWIDAVDAPESPFNPNPI